MIYPEDLKKFKELMPNGKVFECVKDGNPYITIQYADMEFRVIPDLFKTVKDPEKKIGEKIKLKETETEGFIDDITWHFQRKAHMYHVKINGKKNLRDIGWRILKIEN